MRKSVWPATTKYTEPPASSSATPQRTAARPETDLAAPLARHDARAAKEGLDVEGPTVEARRKVPDQVDHCGSGEGRPHGS